VSNVIDLAIIRRDRTDYSEIVGRLQAAVDKVREARARQDDFAVIAALEEADAALNQLKHRR